MFSFLRKLFGKPPITPDQLAFLERKLGELAGEENNPLEIAITYLLAGYPLSGMQIVQPFRGATVELLLKENNPTTPPLVLEYPEGPPLLAIFTQRRRTTRCQELHPEYRFYLRVPFPVLLEKMKEGTGIVINPDEEFLTMEFSPVKLNILKKAIFRAPFPPPVPLI